MVPASVQDRAEQGERILRRLAHVVEQTVFEYCRYHGYAFVTRYKTVESLAEKIETGRYKRWSELEDLFACTVVVPTLEQEPDALTFLKKSFQERRVRKRGQAAKSPEVFRFDSTRFIGSLRKIEGADYPDEIWSKLFEVQIRTAFEHAWCVTTHGLTYKGREIDWRRLRLSAQLKAAVEQLDLLVLGFDEATQHVAEHEWFDVAGPKRVVDTFKPLFDQRTLPAEVEPKDWTRFSNNLFTLIFASANAPPGRDRKLDFLGEGLARAARAVRETGEKLVPRSVSLLQWVFAILTDESFLQPPLQNYVPLITPELRSLFPSVSKFHGVFDLDT